ncbi:Histone-lysine N-methyltransferase SETMAR [Habropoda laboriosa]|uniref:Histone-lysine N-methyltransferase SETMAR n=1 Tax=Habropoda laboriosa TaxID=597456 RepID=A0A0L7QYX0_9HYME|nr:Histone-lysine N-methyltransferase SETMAR [Habropoda laboriosa]
MYGVKLWRFKERAEIEKIQVRYIKWTLGLDIRTPDYLVLEETKREKLRVKAGIRARKFEEVVRKDVERKMSKYNLIPHELSPKNLLDHVSVCVSLRARQIQKEFLYFLIEADEKWILYNNVQKLQITKLSLVNRKGVMYLHDRRKTTRIPLHDNAKPHVASTTVQKLHQLNIDVLPNPLYCPDLSPTNFYFFHSLDDFLTEKQFRKDEDIGNAFQQFLSLRDSDFFSQKCMEHCESYLK